MGSLEVVEDKRTIKFQHFFGLSRNHFYLVGGLEPWNFMTFHILGMSSSQLTNSYFSEG